ncbi:hypothetical protein DFH09DRAFT_1103089 [Mycena vulgaris]|nr:hypothetical protein DFH09DRAFT_1103089 [Mycena vulgaris]
MLPGLLLAHLSCTDCAVASIVYLRSVDGPLILRRGFLIAPAKSTGSAFSSLGVILFDCAWIALHARLTVAAKKLLALRDMREHSVPEPRIKSASSLASAKIFFTSCDLWKLDEGKMKVEIKGEVHHGLDPATPGLPKGKPLTASCLSTSSSARAVFVFWLKYGTPLLADSRSNTRRYTASMKIAAAPATTPTRKPAPPPGMASPAARTPTRDVPVPNYESIPARAPSIKDAIFGRTRRELAGPPLRAPPSVLALRPRLSPSPPHPYPFVVTDLRPLPRPVPLPRSVARPTSASLSIPLFSQSPPPPSMPFYVPRLRRMTRRAARAPWEAGQGCASVVNAARWRRGLPPDLTLGAARRRVGLDLLVEDSVLTVSKACCPLAFEHASADTLSPSAALDADARRWGSKTCAICLGSKIRTNGVADDGRGWARVAARRGVEVESIPSIAVAFFGAKCHRVLLEQI